MVTLTSPQFAGIERIEFNKAKSSKEFATALGYDRDRDVFNGSGTEEETSLPIVKNAALKGGSTYNLVLNVYPKHHAVNANPLQVTVKVKILK